MGRNEETLIYTTSSLSPKIVLEELVRNLSSTMIGVFVVILVLIGDLKVSIWVLTCILFTLVGIAGGMRFAGLTIEIMTVMLLVLSVGLAVDYSTHVAQKFMVTHADSKNGTRRILLQIHCCRTSCKINL